MAWWPEYEVLERDGRLLVGRSPRVRRGNKVGLGGGAPSWAMAALGVLSAAGGLWCFRQALAGDFDAVAPPMSGRI